jgi:hypothetical protein
MVERAGEKEGGGGGAQLQGKIQLQRLISSWSSRCRPSGADAKRNAAGVGLESEKGRERRHGG